MITLAHLSDLHLDGGPHCAARAARVAEYLAGLPGTVDAIVVSGDITDSGAIADYAAALEFAAALPAPVLFCPGNHDDRTAFAGVLLGRDGHDGPVNQAWQVAGASILLCDSTIPGQSAGALGPDTLAWLDETLAGGPADRPAFVVMHHPPVPLGVPGIDAIGLRDADELAAVLSRHPRVAALLCGHAHTAAASTFADIPLRVAPGVKSTLMLPWERTPESMMDFDLPVALAFHGYANGLLTTHFRAL